MNRLLPAIHLVLLNFELTLRLRLSSPFAINVIWWYDGLDFVYVTNYLLVSKYCFFQFAVYCFHLESVSWIVVILENPRSLRPIIPPLKQQLSLPSPQFSIFSFAKLLLIYSTIDETECFWIIDFIKNEFIHTKTWWWDFVCIFYHGVPLCVWTWLDIVVYRISMSTPINSSGTVPATSHVSTFAQSSTWRRYSGTKTEISCFLLKSKRRYYVLRVLFVLSLVLYDRVNVV